ncbi:hypothetical protein ACFFWC_06720 [Plantactinospora siamensis]|uniref:Integral membrane protein n=1 Tax=Plantactinospora siamensis TaxID=555372 RepID=A0ABV6NX05_9ACTN
MHRMMGWPLWARGIVLGALFGCLTAGWRLLADPGAGSRFAALLFLVGGVPYGMIMALFTARQQRRFDPADGPRLTDAERRQAFEAVRRGVPPDNPRVAAAALAVARLQLGQRGGAAGAAILVGGLAVLTAALAVFDRPAYWIPTLVLAALAPALTRQTALARRRSADYLVLARIDPGNRSADPAAPRQTTAGSGPAAGTA